MRSHRVQTKFVLALAHKFLHIQNSIPVKVKHAKVSKQIKSGRNDISNNTIMNPYKHQDEPHAYFLLRDDFPLEFDTGFALFGDDLHCGTFLCRVAASCYRRSSARRRALSQPPVPYALP
jgi:hypothetical protein